MAEVLINNGANVNTAAYDGDSPLNTACVAGIKNHSNEFISNPQIILLKLLALGHKNIIELLIRRGADVNSANNRKLSPLHRASTFGNHFKAAIRKL